MVLFVFMDFLWHEVSEKERDEIRKKAKSILDDFSGKLSKVKDVEESLIERKECERQEGEEGDDSFSREIMFENAPKKNKDFIIGEEGGW